MSNFNQEISRNFYYCRDEKFKDLLVQNGFNYICNGISISTKKEFFLFQRNDELNKKIHEYYN